MVEWTERAGEKREVTNEGWEGENNDKKGKKNLMKEEYQCVKWKKGNSKVNEKTEELKKSTLEGRK